MSIGTEIRNRSLDEGRPERAVGARPALDRCIRDEQGQSMVEFALILPVVAFILFAILRFGVAFDDYLQITDAARTAGRQASVTAGNPCDTIDAYLTANYPGLDIAVDRTDPSTNCTSTAGLQWSAVVAQRTTQTIDLPGLPSPTLYTYRLKTTVVERKEQ